jgi:hypothetical protein
MLMFLEKHKLTDSGESAGTSAVTIASGREVPVGMYDGGLIAVVDATAARRLLQRWSLGRKLLALVTTGFGDVFAWDEDTREIYFLNVQYATLEYVDDEIEWFLDNFLEDPTIVDKVLRKARFQELVRLNRFLNYHEAFLLQPWLMFGGVDRVENYGIGSCGTYLDLVGQTT